MKSSSKSAERHGTVRTLTLLYLHQLTKADLEALAEFAERRMGWLPQAHSSGEYAVQTALQAILSGAMHRSGGRRPRLSNLHSQKAFMHYIRSTINSLVEAAKRKKTSRVIHEIVHGGSDLDEQEAIDLLTAPVSADQDLAWLDLKRELFARMHRAASPRLLAFITKWENSFLWDLELPAWKKRAFRDRVRRLAIRVLRQMAEDFGR